MTVMSSLDLREDWRALLGRRPALAETLAVYDGILDRWAGSSAPVVQVRWTAEQCRERWARQVPLLAGMPVPFSPDEVEALLGLALGLLASVGAAEEAALQRFAEGWGRGGIGPAAALPAQGRGGAPLARRCGGGGWVSRGLRCPFWGNDRATDLPRLQPEAQEEGYVISTCQQCRGYVKELDRRVRWNAGPARVEGGGSPHFGPDVPSHRH